MKINHELRDDNNHKKYFVILGKDKERGGDEWRGSKGEVPKTKINNIKKWSLVSLKGLLELSKPPKYRGRVLR